MRRLGAWPFIIGMLLLAAQAMRYYDPPIVLLVALVFAAIVYAWERKRHA